MRDQDNDFGQRYHSCDDNLDQQTRLHVEAWLLIVVQSSDRAILPEAAEKHDTNGQSVDGVPEKNKQVRRHKSDIFVIIIWWLLCASWMLLVIFMILNVEVDS